MIRKSACSIVRSLGGLGIALVVIGVGLLPSHTSGAYELRLYDGENLITAYRVHRATLLAALEALGVPIDDPAFRE